MMSLLMESVVTAFTLGAVIGAVVAMHLLGPKKQSAKIAEQAREGALEP